MPELDRPVLSLRAVLGGGATLLAALLLLTGAPTAQAEAPTVHPSTLAAVQRALHVPADGADGPVTRRAVRRFQRKHDLRVTGVADAATLAKLGITARAAGTGDGVLARIAQCESGGNPAAVSRNGRYRGKYQFSRATWRSLGGTGDPAAAPEAEQDRLAAALYAREGVAPWPSCGARAGA